jgi:hypothetical protein
MGTSLSICEEMKTNLPRVTVNEAICPHMVGE